MVPLREGKTHYKGDVRHGDVQPMVLTDDGIIVVPVATEYDEATDTTTIYWQESDL